MALNWKALAPHRPLSPADIAAGAYVPRSAGGAAAMSALLDAGLEQPMALFGPSGSGKSTELAALVHVRDARWVGPLIRLDKMLAYSDETEVSDALDAMALATVRLALERQVPLSEPLVNLARVMSQPAGHPIAGIIQDIQRSGPRGFDLLLAIVREIRIATRNGAVALLVDGLEKAGRALAAGVLADLERLRGEAIVAVVVPMSVATGPGAAALGDYHLVPVNPIDVDGQQGVDFMLSILRRRLGAPALPVTPLLQLCAVLSGGLVRTFLQLVESAALYAAMRGSEEPSDMDVTRAAQDQTNFLLRLLKSGDVNALRKADRTNGLEVDIKRRIRFLGNGLLLEYQTPAGPVVRISPLLHEAVLRDQSA